MVLGRHHVFCTFFFFFYSVFSACVVKRFFIKPGGLRLCNIFSKQRLGGKGSFSGYRHLAEIWNLASLQSYTCKTVLFNPIGRSHAQVHFSIPFKKMKEAYCLASTSG